MDFKGCTIMIPIAAEDRLNICNVTILLDIFPSFALRNCFMGNIYDFLAQFPGVLESGRRKKDRPALR